MLVLDSLVKQPERAPRTSIGTMGGVPSKADPSKGELQVIAAGYSRTGTVSIQLALEHLLDGPVLHGGTHVLAREDCKLTYGVKYQAKRADVG